MKKNIILLMLLCLSMITYAVNPIKEGNMISGHVITPVRDKILFIKSW